MSTIIMCAFRSQWGITQRHTLEAPTAQKDEIPYNQITYSKYWKITLAWLPRNIHRNSINYINTHAIYRNVRGEGIQTRSWGEQAKHKHHPLPLRITTILKFILGFLFVFIFCLFPLLLSRRRHIILFICRYVWTRSPPATFHFSATPAGARRHAICAIDDIIRTGLL